MGSLMAGWDSPVLADDDKKGIRERTAVARDGTRSLILINSSYCVSFDVLYNTQLTRAGTGR